MTKNWKSVLSQLVRGARGTESQVVYARCAKVSDRLIGQIENKTIKNKPRIKTIIKLALGAGESPQIWLKKLKIRIAVIGTSPERSDIPVSRSEFEAFKKCMIHWMGEMIETMGQLVAKLKS